LAELGGGGKLQFIGERENGLRRLRTFLQKGSKNSKNLQKALIMNTFLKVLEESPERNFFQEVPLWRSPVLPDKSKFENI
jgi:hypothetical protein